MRFPEIHFNMKTVNKPLKLMQAVTVFPTCLLILFKGTGEEGGGVCYTSPCNNWIANCVLYASNGMT